MKNNILLFLFLLGVTIITAQKKISGNVIDKKTGEPIVGAHVEAYPSQKIAVTNMDGSYTLFGIENGDTKLKVTMVGYQPISQDIVGIHIHPLNFELEELLKDFEEVIVTGTRTMKTLDNTPILTKLINHKQIEAAGATSVLDALEFAIPGLNFSRNHGVSMQIQGLSNRYILVLLDGQRMIGESLDQENMTRINADDIERIEVLGGAASALYGSSAIGSVINIITKKNTRKWQGNLGVRYEPENKDLINDLSVGYKNKKLDVRFSGFRRYSDGYDLDTSDTYATQPSYTDYSARLSAVYQFSPKFQIEADGRYFRSDNESGDPNVSGHKLKENYTYGVGVKVSPSAKHVIDLKANADESKQTHTNLGDTPDEVFGENKFRTLSLLDTYTHNDDLQIVLGTDYNYEGVFSLTVFGDKPTTKEITDFNAFIQTDYKILSDLEFVAGLRYTCHETFGSHYTPKFTLMYKLDNWRFRGNLSWGYKAPSLKHLYYNFFMGGMFWIYGNPDLEPENSFYNSFSIEYTKKSFNASVNLFKNKLEDKIHSYYAINKDTGKQALYYRNYKDVRIKGVEAFVKVRLLDNFTSHLGYNFVYTKDLETNRPLPKVSKHSAVAGVSWGLSQVKYPLSVNVSFRAHSDRKYFEEKKGTTPGSVVLEEKKEEGFEIWKASYSQDFELYKSFRLKAQLGVDNIFNYKENKTAISPGRTFWGALKIYL